VKINEFFAAQLEREAAISKRSLERVPEGKADWKPHEKSMPLGYLSQLVATMPTWIELAIAQDSLDLNPPDGKKFTPPDTSTRAKLLEAHDAAVKKTLGLLTGTNDEFLATPWKLLFGGNVVQENPRHVVIADVFTHLAHHRGQLTVYLRLLGEKVPSVYGPTADEKGF
jgi:uncharacterized damage-inducible protein DinB